MGKRKRVKSSRLKQASQVRVERDDRANVLALPTTHSGYILAPCGPPAPSTIDSLVQD